MSTHSDLSPSSFHANDLCAGRHNFTKDMPEIETLEAAKGTTAHELLEGWFNRTIALDVTTFKGTNGVEIDADNIAEVKKSYEYVMEILFFRPKAKLFTEVKVDPEYQHNGKSVAFGTVDIVIVDPEDETVFVLDYKNGMIYVNELDNRQLLLYAIGVICTLYEWGFSTRPAKIVLGILQPRISVLGHVPFRLWEINNKTVTRWHRYFKQRIPEILNSTGLTAGETQCRWCKARGNCETQSKHALELALSTTLDINMENLQKIEDATLIDPGQLTDDQLQTIMSSKDFITGWLSAVQDHIERRFNHHQPLQGFKMVRGRGSRKWSQNDEDEMVKLFFSIFNVPREKLFTHKLKSPAGFEKSVKSLLTKEQWKSLEKHIQKTKGKPVLARDSDPRQAVALEAKEVFDVVEPNEPMDLSFLD